MSKKLAMTPTIKTSNATKPEKVACPKCDAWLSSIGETSLIATSALSKAQLQVQRIPIDARQHHSTRRTIRSF